MRHLFRWFEVLLAASLIGALFGCAAREIHSKPGTTTTIILTRHADRDEFHDDLNAKGRQRAIALVEAVKGLGVTAIYSPDVKRNLDTARPLAAHFRIEITRTPALSYFKMQSIVQEIVDKHPGGVVVWIGNVSGNLQQMYRLLGGTDDPPWEYGDLFVMTIPDNGSVRVVKKRYGP